MGAEKDCLLSLHDINISGFGGVGFDHPEHLNFSFPKTSAAPAVPDQISLLPKGEGVYKHLQEQFLAFFPALVLK